MYPLAEGQLYPRNNWYVAAHRSEVGRDLLERTILGEPVVFFRTLAGQAVAFAGLCPHRFFPLAQSKLVGDTLKCGYHGLTYDTGGKCTLVPAQDRVPGHFRTRSYPVQEKWEWIWIWTGDVEAADPALLPDLASIGVDTPGWRADSAGYHHVQARYTLLIDNLMDLSHIAFVHAGSIPGWEYTLDAEPKSEVLSNMFRFQRQFSNVPMDEFSKMLHPDLDGPIDNVVVSEYLGPGLVNAGGPYVSKPGDANIRKMNFVHALTPETPHTTHYFMATARNFRTDDDDLSLALSSSMIRVAMEDVVAMNAIEPRLDQCASTAKELYCMGDAGGVRVRRLLMAQIDKETTTKGDR